MEVLFHKPFIAEEEISEVVDTLKSGWITMGPKTLRFEEAFADYVSSTHAVAVSSGTAGLHLALKATDLKSGDEVIVPSNTFTATAEVVCHVGAKPVIVDVDRETQNIGVAAIEKALTPRTKAVIPVHFSGQPCDMDEIIDLARRRRFFVIEDAAHAIPAWYRGRIVGSIGDLTCFSFYSTKPLATGEGGMVTSGKEEWADRIRTLRLHGISKDAWKRYTKGGTWFYEVLEPGFKYNMTDLQAGLGIAQLKRVDQLWELRKRIARRYTEAFDSMPELITPSIQPDRETSWHLYAIRLRPETLSLNRNSFIEKLRGRGIETSVHFIPLHRHPYYRDTLGLRKEDYPHAEWNYERTVSLPIYPGMTDAEVTYVIEQVSDLCLEWRK